MENKKRAIIIGAGPAGLTAAYELLTRTNIVPIVVEKSEHMGGISRTINYKGNRIDIGGHRFFSKSDRIMVWWQQILPLQKIEGVQKIAYQSRSRDLEPLSSEIDPSTTDAVMLLRKRKSRIYYNRQFFAYPLKINRDTVKKLGYFNTLKIGCSYLKSVAFPIRPEVNLEDFFINRFGKRLYKTFFKSYTEKVWGLPCNQINAEWGAQRVKGLSITGTIKHALSTILRKNNDIAQKNTETSLIEQFLYPKYGPGQMWQEVAKKVEALGGTILTNTIAEKIVAENNQIHAVEVQNIKTNETKTLRGDYFFSTMPIKELVASLQIEIPKNIKLISDGLLYRDFITVGLLCNRLKIKDPGGNDITDNWIYIQESDVLVGRLQIFNNWSPYMVSDPTKMWIGLEYFCNETDELWNKSDKNLIDLAKYEMEKIGIVDQVDVIDATVMRVEKTYPAYFGTYNQFDTLRQYLDSFQNLFLLGRNGMHRYNNQDHSMLTAMTAVDNIIAGITDKANIWAVNTEQEYHESKK